MLALIAEVINRLLEIWRMLADRLLMSQNYKRSNTTPNNKESAPKPVQGREGERPVIVFNVVLNIENQAAFTAPHSTLPAIRGRSSGSRGLDCRPVAPL